MPSTRRRLSSPSSLSWNGETGAALQPKRGSVTRIQEIRIIAIDGIEIPDGVGEGTELVITAALLVSKIDQEWVDVTVYAGKPEQLPGSVTVCTVARECVVNASPVSA